jgi:hypothetical protein
MSLPVQLAAIRLDVVVIMALNALRSLLGVRHCRRPALWHISRRLMVPRRRLQMRLSIGCYKTAVTYVTVVVTAYTLHAVQQGTSRSLRLLRHANAMP